MELILLGLGLVILLVAGDLLVRGSVNLSLRLGVPALVVGLTVVAFGTSAPELLVAIQAVLDDLPGIALGNVVGSNIANILLVLGVPALISGIRSSECDSQHSYVMMLGASVLFIALCFFGPITWWHAVLLLAGLAFMLTDSYRHARRARRESAVDAADEIEELEEADPDMPYWRIALYLVAGLLGLPLGADLLVDSASVIAERYGVSDAIIGLTIIAVGTSLPELATSVMAALRGQADVAMGNVIGSNMFNLLGIMGMAGLVGPISIAEEFLNFDLWVMLGSTLVLFPFVMFCRDITRFWGGVLMALYAVYVTALLAL